MARCAGGGIIRSSLATRYQLGFLAQAGSVTAPLSAARPRGTCEFAMNSGSTTWSALDGEALISLSPGHPHQQLIDKHLLKAGVKTKTKSVVNLLDTQIALVEAEEGIIATWAGGAGVL
jgi:hypothetical protein